MVAAYLVVAWEPFDVDLPRHVTNDAVVTAAGDLVTEQGMLASPGAAPFVAAARAARSLTIELEVQPLRQGQRGPAPILAIASDEHHANLVIAQISDNIVVQVRHPASTPAGESGIRVRDAIRGTVPHRIVVRVEDDSLDIEVDGVVHASQSLSRPVFGTWNPAYPVTLGNVPAGGRPWAGTITAATVDVGDGPVDLLRPGVLERPSSWWVLPWRGRSFATDPDAPDVALNVLGFVPLGVLMAMTSGRRRLVRAAAATAAVSLVMEAGQVLLPSRDPSVVDLATNVAGGMLGTALVLVYERRRRRDASSRS